jgi:hypothetical protein
MRGLVRRTSAALISTVAHGPSRTAGTGTAVGDGMFKALVFSSLLLTATATTAAVVQPIGAHYQLLIPAAGSNAGANGTFFRSDITILNLTPRTQTVRLEWLSQGGEANRTRFIEIGPSTGFRSADFVPEVLQTTGLGAIVVTAMTSQSGSVDPTGQLYVSSRIWTPQPGTTGTTSQSMPAIPATTIDTPSASLFAVGGGPAPDRPEDYRVNIGIVNLDPVNAQTYAIYVPTPTLPIPTSVTVPPSSMMQVGMGNDIQPTAQFVVENTTPAGSRSNRWVAYHSTLNNITGDAWSELAVAGTNNP